VHVCISRCDVREVEMHGMGCMMERVSSMMASVTTRQRQCNRTCMPYGDGLVVYIGLVISFVMSSAPEKTPNIMAA